MSRRERKERERMNQRKLLLSEEFEPSLPEMEEFQSVKTYINSREFKAEEDKFKVWLEDVRKVYPQTMIQVRSDVRLVWKSPNLVNIQSKTLRTRQIHVSLQNMHSMKSPLKALYFSSYLSNNEEGSISLKDVEKYLEGLDDDENPERKTFLVSWMGMKLISKEDEEGEDYVLLASGYKRHRKEQETCKSNIPLFENVRNFARMNQCWCQPGKKGKNCSDFLICPFEFQHPIQSISDLVSSANYSCVGLAISIVVFQAFASDHKMFSVHMRQSQKTLLHNQISSLVLPLDKHKEIEHERQKYAEAIEELMNWTSSHKIESYGIDVKGGVLVANQFMQSHQLKTHLAFFDLFKETIDVIRQVELSESMDNSMYVRSVRKRLCELASKEKGFKTFYLVYYLTHVLVMWASSAEEMLISFARKFVEVRMKPYKLMPNNNSLSFFSLDSCVTPEIFKQVSESFYVSPQAILHFDSRKASLNDSRKAKFQFSPQIYQEYDLTRSLAVQDSPETQVFLERVKKVRTKSFSQIGIAAFDIETCKETDQDLLRCGDGNQIPYMLSLKGRLFDYRAKTMVDVEKLFVQKSNFDDVWNSVTHQFVQFLINGNHFSPPEEKTINYIFAHNGSKFDFLFVLRWLSIYQQVTRFNIVGSPDHMKGIICSGLTFYDSFLLISKSLNQIAKDFLGQQKHEGVDIGNVNKDDLTSTAFNTGTASQPSRFERISAYCMQDSVLLYECVNKFLLTQYIVPLRVVSSDQTTFVFGAKPIHMTASSMSMSLFASVFLKYPLGCVQKFLPYERDTYSGGFTCNFRSHASFGFSFDINSAYPAQMQGKMPLAHYSQSEFVPVELRIEGQTDLKQFQETNLYKVSYSFTLDEETAFITRTQCRTALIELTQQPNIWMWGVQLNHLLELLKHQPQQSFVYVHTEIRYVARPIYKEYIQTIYQARQDNKDNQVLNAMYKMLMCGLYGKHGQKDVKSNQMFSSIQDAIDYVSIAKCYLNRFKPEAEQKQNMWLYVVRAMKDAQIVDSTVNFIHSQQPIIYGVELLEPGQQHVGSLVRMASYISSRTRVYLINSYRQIVSHMANHCRVSYARMRKLFQLVYCDTDSLYIDAHMLISKLLEEKPDLHDDQRIQDYVLKCNNNEFITYTFEQSKTQEGLDSLRDLYAYLLEKSEVIQLLTSVQVTNPENSADTIPFLDQNKLGSFKIEKYMLVGAFAAPKQYSLYYSDIPGGKVKNDIRLKGVRRESRAKFPRSIFDQVDAFKSLLQTFSKHGFGKLNSALLSKEQISQLVEALKQQDPSFVDRITMKYDDLVQFRGHKTGVSIYTLVKYISFVMNKRVVELDENDQCVMSTPHDSHQSYVMQRTNLLAVSKLLRKLRMNSSKNQETLSDTNGQIATCVYAVKTDNLIKRDFQRMVDENCTPQASWFYEQTLMQNSCTSLLDKIGNSQATLFTYVRSNTPVNFRIVQTFMTLVKCKAQLAECFVQAVNDYEIIKDFVDQEVLRKAYRNNLFRDIINPGTDDQTVENIYGQLMLLNICIAKWVWLKEKTQPDIVDQTLDTFCSYFSQQKSKDKRKKDMTESMINYNLGVVFNVTMFQYTCKVVSQALALDNLPLGQDEQRRRRIQNAWSYDNDMNTRRQSLSEAKVDYFLGMAPEVTLNDYVSNDSDFE